MKRRWKYILADEIGALYASAKVECLCLQEIDYEEESVLRAGCKEYFWLLCKLIDNIHVKDASQVCRYDSYCSLMLEI